MPRESQFEMKLSSKERQTLEAMARKYPSPYRDVIRAKIILLSDRGLSNDVIAARLDTPRQIVTKWHSAPSGQTMFLEAERRSAL
jgi:hypothetical protein